MALLETQGLTAFYGDFQALFGVDMMLEEGETIAVIGANGAGKSTLLRSLSGDLRCTGGNVRLKGRDLTSFSSRELAKHRVMLSQHVNVSFPFTVEEIVAMGAGDRSRATAAPLVDAAIAELAKRGVRKAVKLAVSVPSHTPLMREAANRLAEAMRAYTWHQPSIPVVQNVDARIHESTAAIRDALERQLYLPVRWTECVQALMASDCTRMAECGPGKVLAGLARRIDKNMDMRTLGTPAELEDARTAWA